MIQIEVRQLGHLPCLYSHLSKAWLLHVLVATERFIQLSTCLDNKAVDHTKKIKKRTATEGYRDEGGALGVSLFFHPTNDSASSHDISAQRAQTGQPH